MSDIGSHDRPAEDINTEIRNKFLSSQLCYRFLCSRLCPCFSPRHVDMFMLFFMFSFLSLFLFLFLLSFPLVFFLRCAFLFPVLTLIPCVFDFAHFCVFVPSLTLVRVLSYVTLRPSVLLLVLPNDILHSFMDGGFSPQAEHVKILRWPMEICSELCFRVAVPFSYRLHWDLGSVFCGLIYSLYCQKLIVAYVHVPTAIGNSTVMSTFPTLEI
jgi:hypothetical protein